MSKVLQGYARKLGELGKDIVKPHLAFERNKTLANLATDVKSLGSLNVQHKGDSQDKKLPVKKFSTIFLYC